MNSRERFHAIAGFRKPDRWFFWPEGIGQQALQRWKEEEGFPASRDKNKLQYDYGADRLREAKPVGLGFDTGPVPRFPEEILEETGHFQVFRTENGKKRRLDLRSGIGHVDEFPVKDRGDFDVLKERYHPETPERYAESWNGTAGELRKRDYPVVLKVRGFFGACLGWMGFTNLCLAIQDDPEFVDGMMKYWGSFLEVLLAPLLREKVVDCVMIAELGLTHTTGPSISPDAVKRFMIPRYTRMIGYLRSFGIQHIWFRNKGNLEKILPAFLGAGISGISNLNQASGNDPVKLRREYPSLVMMGGLDKRCLLRGETAIRNEVNSKVPVLTETGGYFPCLDAGLLQDVSFASFVSYRRILENACALRPFPDN